ncbi:hypothetical protein AB1Y20_020624 [Prymnesium parvum]|uniref:Uncharacterized protein n=1 Tax=Prymnesium parvum TaxID=97485 RepID=A0AB34JY52_PRYPA
MLFDFLPKHRTPNTAGGFEEKLGRPPRISMALQLEEICNSSLPSAVINLLRQQALQIIVLQCERKAQAESICSLRARLIAAESAQGDLQRRLMDAQQRLLLMEDESRVLKHELRHVSLPRLALSASAPSTAEHPPPPSLPRLHSPPRHAAPFALASADQQPSLVRAASTSGEAVEALQPNDAVKAELPSGQKKTKCCPGSQAALLQVKALSAVEAEPPVLADAQVSSSVIMKAAKSINSGKSKPSADSLSTTSSSSSQATVEATTCRSPSMLDLLCTAAHYNDIEPPSETAAASPASAASTSPANSPAPARAAVPESKLVDSSLVLQSVRPPVPPTCTNGMFAGCEAPSKERKRLADMMVPDHLVKRTRCMPVVHKSPGVCTIGAAGSLARIRQQAAAGMGIGLQL